MQQLGRLTSLKVIIKLDKLNTAKKLYEEASDEKTKQEADRTFADCYDWFVQRDLIITYDTKHDLWFFTGR